MSERYKVISGSQSAHCCFEATVVDTSRPDMQGDGTQYVGDHGPQFEAVCECFDMVDAEAICAALNASPPSKIE